jgi:hypothetical protein
VRTATRNGTADPQNSAEAPMHAADRLVKGVSTWCSEGRHWARVNCGFERSAESVHIDESQLGPVNTPLYTRHSLHCCHSLSAHHFSRA